MTDWPLYQGTKQLKALPMKKAAYCELRGWTIPADEDPNERGYVVEYQDGGKANLEGYAGYVSWSPADVFERSYRRCGTHVERMQIELQELNEKLYKLNVFMLTHTFRELDQNRRFWMEKQRNAMTDYEFALRLRVEFALTEPPESA